MFRTVSLIAFIAVIGGILLHHLLFPCGPGSRFTLSAIIRKKVHLFTLLFLEQSLNWGSRLRKLAFLLGLLSFAVLLLTGFVPMLLGGRLEGYWLMLHATFAPVLIACGAVVVITGAQQYSFRKRDIDSLTGLWKTRLTRNTCWLSDCSAARRSASGC
jgi:peptidoglycan/LPS O-acetylase OafA/YrhL